MKSAETVTEYTVGIQAMDPALPLAVRVGIALGRRIRRVEWTHTAGRNDVLATCFMEESFPMPTVTTPPPHQHVGFEVWAPYEYEPTDGDWTALADYPTQWAATGPLIEKYRVALSPTSDAAGTWVGTLDRPYRYLEKDILRGVCRVIVDLAAAGKLELTRG